MKKQSESLRKQHPVPQNIMEVEFKLIGDMTIRQFGYIAVGAVIAYVIYSQNLPSIIRWPLVIFVVLVAMATAFLPMEERGMDQWIKNFFTACYSPTQRAWKKTPFWQERPSNPTKGEDLGKAKSTHKDEIKKDKIPKKAILEEVSQGELAQKTAEVSKTLDRVLEQLGKPEKSPTSSKELREDNRQLRKQITSLGTEYKKIKERETFGSGSSNLKQTVDFYQEQLETIKEKNKILEEELKKGESQLDKKEEKAPEPKEHQKRIQELKKENESLDQKMANISKQTKDLKQKVTQLSGRNEDYTKDLTNKETELKNLENERNRAVSGLVKLSKELQELKKQPAATSPTEKPKERKEKEAKERELPKKLKEKVVEEKAVPIIGKIPNVINGIVKNREGRFLPATMVIIEDEDGDTVRALKTNKLGQFVVINPLPNGTYTVKVRSEKLFSPVNILVDGSVLEPIIFKEAGRP